MNRNILRASVAVAAVVGAAVVSTASAQADTAATGSVVITESKTFATAAAKAGIGAVALPSAKVTVKTLSASFPVTGATVQFPDSETVDVANFVGDIQVGGGLVVADVKTGKTVTFHKLAFSAYTYQITAVKDGTTTPVALLDVSGNPEGSGTGTVPQTLTSDLALDADGAKVLDSALKTKFFVEGQTVGGLNLTFTPATVTVP